MFLSYLVQLLINDPLQFLVVIIVLFVPLLLSITIHEWAHGYTAYKFGDPTPEVTGRLTLNPFAHLDPVGTLMLFIVGIGWAKPVMINPKNIASATKQMLVALAGPFSNLMLAIIGTILSVYLQSSYNLGGFVSLVNTALTLFVRINLLLCLFNLMPIPPLDGSRIVAWILPDKLKNIYYKVEPYGFIILVIVFYTVGFDFIFDFVGTLQKGLFFLVQNLGR